MTGANIRQSGPADAPAVAKFCQPIYAAVYPNAKYGLKPEHFSPEVFQTSNTLEYFAHTLANHANQRAFVVENRDRIIGSISIEFLPGHADIHAFYVARGFQGQGIGTRLMARALENCPSDLSVRAEIAESNTEIMKIYEKWGFQEAPELGLSLRHWPEWPDGLQNGYVYYVAKAGDIRA